VRHRILIVDDERAMLNLFSTVLKDGYVVETARSAEEALTRLRSQDSFSVLVTDIFLPGISGIELLSQCAKISPDTVRIAITGNPGRETVVDSVNEGNVFRFVSKPVRMEALLGIVDAAVQRYDSLQVEREMMETTVRTSLNLMLEVLATLDPPSFELSQRVRGSIRVFARAMRLPNVWELELSASLARIGVVTLPAEVLRKVARDAPLSRREMELLAQVPGVGSQLLKQVPRMDRVATAIRYQAKNFDGSGSPSDAVAGFEIPIGARVLRIFMDRALLEIDGIAKSQARREMESRTGVYDPALLEASFSCFPEYILSALSADNEVKLVSADELEADYTLVTEIRSSDRMLLVSAGTRLTPLIVQRIRTYIALGTVAGPFGVQMAPPDRDVTLVGVASAAVAAE
jgi:response regulator RpfG family c-di-GMP phosphodiesterase